MRNIFVVLLMLLKYGFYLYWFILLLSEAVGRRNYAKLLCLKVHRKLTVSEASIKNSPRRRFLPLNLVKFFRTTILKSICEENEMKT